MNNLTLYNSDCRHMSELADESIHCIITSPPYWGLRKYAGVPDMVWGGKNNHEHEWSNKILQQATAGDKPGANSKVAIHRPNDTVNRPTIIENTCSLCGAWKGQFGLEPTPSLYIQHAVEIFRECKRVLRPDGVLFLNCGDSYFASGGAHKPHHANPGLSKSARRGGVPHGGQSGKHGKGLLDCAGRDSSSESPCGECVKMWSLRMIGNDGNLALIPETLSGVSIHSHKELKPDHQDSLRLTFQADQSADETLGLCSFQDSLLGVSLGVLESTNPESFGQLQGGCLPKDNTSVSQDVISSLSHVFRVCGHRKACPFFARIFSGVSLDSAYLSAHGNPGTSLTGGASAGHISGKVYDFSVSPYPYSTIKNILCQVPNKQIIILYIIFNNSTYFDIISIHFKGIYLLFKA
jgi:hypothetical protein